MADVHVTTVNPSGQKAVFSMDESDDRIAHFRVLVRRGDLEAVDVKKAPAPKTAGR